ncbi:MAG: tRNA uridine(34) 5-carboxymethylaminomethyl modification radical SAM/GNAT enzyme Elp3 [Candidatus Altiarchaeales archaeon]|nr:tRNA uridine(34) 5-carboxymethylaminomethyl modification radical SAM/GNAT enzyme Elp3 [Candidatus Altiarchaeales archaeon]MBD3416969.1 tRNA uridine(34) 5-carboxymethylaminomethyl modification radical SAM/GNAT enzyme Elp3 [Candidatus Altiarchaeales archaeon]
MDCRDIVERILSGEIDSRERLEDEKREYAVRHGLDRFIRNSEILSAATQEEMKRILKILQKKPTRTMSGVAVVAAMTRPHECPHGKCRYCPGGPDSDVPQSYTGKEPATRRAIQYGYDPYLQTTFRLAQLKTIGHPVDKAELIVMGGTLTAQCLDYQEWFVKECLRAMNDFDNSYASIKRDGEEEFIYNYEKSVKRFNYIEKIQEENESSAVRCVGMTFEPRPDWARREQIDLMLGFGVTRVEVGVQNPDDRIYEEIERGHTVEDVVDATRELKDSGLKVGYHIMPGLRGYDPTLDLGAFKKVFTDDRFKPDMLKIYPCIVMEGTDYSMKYRTGEFTPLTTEEAVEVIVKAKSMMPKWVRTMRIMRDIPSNIVEAGIKASNLGQLVHDEMERQGIRCSCIRCREAGRHLRRGVEPDMDSIKLLREDYSASGGTEVFLSFEDVELDILIGFARLRTPGEPFRPEITEDTALIRELHVYGPMVELGEKPEYEWQHRGYGGELIREAERIAAEEFDKTKLTIISGVGVRDYYRKLGYERDGPYMSARIGQ